MSLIVPPPDVDRATWLRWRRSGLGASDIAAVLGISPYASPWSVWADKVGLFAADDDDPAEHMEFGRRAEAMISPWFADLTGFHVAASQLWAQSDTHPWLLATPDGAVTDRDYCTMGGDCPFPSHPEWPHTGLRIDTDDLMVLRDLARTFEGLEIKVAYDSKVWAEIPVHYQAQGQQQMATTGWERIWFAVLHGRRFRVYVLERDEADIKEMIERGAEFWEQHVLARVAPPIDGSEATLEALSRAYPEVDPGSKRDLDHLKGRIDELVQAKADEKAAKERAAAAKAEIWEAMGDAHVGQVGGQQVLTLRSQTKRTICRHCRAVDESDPFRVLNITSTPPKLQKVTAA